MSETTNRITALPEQRAAEMAGAGTRLRPSHRTSRSHASLPRGLSYVAESRTHEGRFGRMFPHLPPYLPSDAEIRAIAQRMREDDHSAADGDNPDIPSGFTYLGQFVDHDITFDPSPLRERTEDPEALTNFRTPRFDLDSLYGRGPADDPYLYDQDNPGGFLVDRHDGLLDLPRNRQGRALIGDPRNDENTFVAHIHLTMLLFHNRVLQEIDTWTDRPLRDDEDRFDATQQVVRWHYQWVVVHDFLRRIVGSDTMDDVLVREPLFPGGHPVLQPRLKFFHWHVRPFIPVEFTGGAYRMGHSMVRARYVLNSIVPPESPPLLILPPEPISEADPLSHFGGFRPLPAHWQVEWPRLFDVSGPGQDNCQPSRLMDELVVPPLHTLPPEVAEGLASLPARNLTRGAHLGLPSGQDVAQAMGITPLTDAELGLPEPGPAPLWYYILREAKVQSGGTHLGAVGGRIVAEVFVGLLAEDPSSFLTRAPGWEPTLPSTQPGTFTMSDLITFTGFGLEEVTG